MKDGRINYVYNFGGLEWYTAASPQALAPGRHSVLYEFTPYATGELFWDRNHHSWNQNQYAFGVQLPYKRHLMVDTYYLRQNCTTCSEDPLNVWGVTLNLYFRSKK